MSGDEVKHYLITYVWRQESGRNMFSMGCYRGTIAGWVMMAMEQPESWSLINSEEISAVEYEQLKDNVC